MQRNVDIATNGLMNNKTHKRLNNNMKHILFRLSQFGAVLSLGALLLCSCDGLLPRKIDLEEEEPEEEEYRLETKENGNEISPDDYYAEIVDYVTYQISELNVWISIMQNDELEYLLDEEEKLSDNILKQYSYPNNDYRSILEEIVETGSNHVLLASALLSEYNSLDIDLSEFKEAPDSSPDKRIWRFYEKNSLIGFTFTWYRETGQWEMSVLGSSVKGYIDSRLGE